jgi:hypothetical protein
LTRSRIFWSEQKEVGVMPAGRHGHKIREYKRRIDALLEAERERRRPLGPPPPPISEEHAALRRQIAEGYRNLLDPENPEGTETLERLEERLDENPELGNVAAQLITLTREERELLAKNGVDYRPYENYQLE